MTQTALSPPSSERIDRPEGSARHAAQAQGLFMHVGSFSGVNRSLIDALALCCPGLGLDTVDLRKALTRDKVQAARLLASGLLEFGLPRPAPASASALSGVRAALRHSLYRSQAGQDAVAALARRRAERMRYALTFQTQSLFDGSVPGVPHFVYTDHAALARPPEESGPPPSEAWLARERRCYRNADHVFTFGPRVRDVIVERYGVPEDRVSAVGAGIQARAAAAPATGTARYEARRVLFVGRAWKRKGGPDLLAAFARVRDALPDATLVVVGTAEPQEAPGVRVTGPLPSDRVAEEFRQASCFCLPSRLEPFGMVVAEAMHHGLPVVATRVGDIPSMVEHETSGLLVPPNAPDALAAALIRVLGDAALSTRYAENGLERASRYTWDAVAAKIARHFPPAVA